MDLSPRIGSWSVKRVNRMMACTAMHSLSMSNDIEGGSVSGPAPTIRDWLRDMRDTFGTTEPATIYCRTPDAPKDWTPGGTARVPVVIRMEDERES